jgi:hypothetical protein
MAQPVLEITVVKSHIIQVNHFPFLVLAYFARFVVLGIDVGTNNSSLDSNYCTRVETVRIATAVFSHDRRANRNGPIM